MVAEVKLMPGWFIRDVRIAASRLKVFPSSAESGVHRTSTQRTARSHSEDIQEKEVEHFDSRGNESQSDSNSRS